MPSGKQLMEELIRALLHPLFTDEAMEGGEFREILNAVVGTWSLEDVFDRASEYGVDVSVLYNELKIINDTAPPNEWHYAVARYYRFKNPTGVLITTNWDDFLERAFCEIGTNFEITSSTDQFGDPQVEQIVNLHHIHGSFRETDVVTSLKSEHRDVAFPVGFYGKPVIFMGYGGYEPSVYEYLYTCTMPQIWIVYDEKEFDDPKKARLLRRNNVRVFKGDLQDVLEVLDGTFSKIQWKLHHFEARLSADYSLNRVLLAYALMSRRIPDAIIDTYHMIKVPLAGNPFLGRAHDFEPRSALFGLAEIIVGILLYTVRNHNVANSIFCHALNLLELGGDGIAARIVASYMLRHTIDERKAIDLSKVLNQPNSIDADCLDKKCGTKSHSIFNDIAYEVFSKKLRGENSVLEGQEDSILHFMEITAMISETPGFLGEHYEIYAQRLFREGKLDEAAATFNHAANFHFLGAQNKAGILCYNVAKNIHSGKIHTLPPSLKLTSEFPFF